jgi:hypothetical protein
VRRFAPDQPGSHWAVWTFAFTLIICFLFAFMAGQFSTYQLKAGVQGATGSWGPSNLQSWLQFMGGADHMFDFPYLQASMQPSS